MTAGTGLAAPPDAVDGYPEYRAHVARLQAQYARIPADRPVRLAKRTSNLFRPRTAATGTLDPTGLSGVLAVDPVARTADVLGMTTYADLLDATLPYGLLPMVVPQLKTITLGGAVTGLGIESASFRNGCPHESVLDLDVLVGDGRVLTVTTDGEHADLFHGFPNSYGSLGYALRLKIALEPVGEFVHLRHVRFDDIAAAAGAIGAIAVERAWDGQRVDLLDGVVFAADEVYLTLGDYTDTAPRTSDYTGMGIYYRSIPARAEDWLSTRDYVWRWDTDWFWCSRAFGAQHPVVRRLWPKHLLRSDVYWRLVALDRRVGFARRLTALRGQPPREDVVQDVEIPADRLADFVPWLIAGTGITPVWLCPVRQRDPAARWELFGLDPARTYVNVGFWSSAPIRPGGRPGDHNRRIEQRVADLQGLKSLYSTAYYSREELFATYGGPAYDRLRARYDPAGRLTGRYEKVVGGR